MPDPTHFDVHCAARDGDLDAVRAYLDGAGDPNALDRYDTSAVYYAVKYDQLEIAQLLVEGGADVHRNSKLRGDPIGAAVWNLNRRMIEFVLAAGVNINRTLDGKTLLDSIDVLRHFAHPRPDELNAIELWLIEHGARRSTELTR